MEAFSGFDSTTRGGQKGVESEAVSLITPPTASRRLAGLPVQSIYEI